MCCELTNLRVLRNLCLFHLKSVFGSVTAGKGIKTRCNKSCLIYDHKHENCYDSYKRKIKHSYCFMTNVHPKKGVMMKS